MEKELYCLCKQPHDDKFMLQCDQCEIWYHGECVEITEDEAEKMRVYQCPSCLKIKEFEEWNPNKKKKVKKIKMDFRQYPSLYSDISDLKEIKELEMISKMKHLGIIQSICLSNDSSIICTASSLGSIQLFDSKTFQLLRKFKDPNEKEIDEFLICKFSLDDKFIITGGKRSSRYEWNEDRDEHEIKKCYLKMIDIETEEFHYIYGHTEEILCLKIIEFENEIYYLTGSYDGSLIKYKMRNNLLIQKSQIMDGISNVISSISFLPESKNRYFLVSADDKIKLFDFKYDQLLQTFDTPYSKYCDCLKFIHFKGEENYFIIKGIENEKNENTKLYLKKLIINDEDEEEEEEHFQIQDISCFESKDFYSNEFLTKFTCNGKYLFVPSQNHQLFIWDIENNNLILKLDISNSMRDILLFNHQLFISSENNIFIYKNKSD